MPPRFDIGSASKFQSRDGGLGTGGQIRNGFVEKAPGGLWSWQRPGLAPGQTAPFSGTAMGLLVLGTDLYGVGVETSGTASSFSIRFTTGTTPFTLVAATGAHVVGTFTSPAGGFLGGNGSVTPGTWNGASVVELFGYIGKPTPPVVDPGSVLTLAGSRASNFLTTVRVGTVGKQTVAAAVSYSGGNTTWLWTGSPIFAGGGTGTFTGGFK